MPLATRPEVRGLVEDLFALSARARGVDARSLAMVLAVACEACADGSLDSFADVAAGFALRKRDAARNRRRTPDALA